MKRPGYKLKVLVRSAYGNAGTWIDIETVYLNPKSAGQRRRRILRKGIPNPFSGQGILPVEAVTLHQVEVF